MKNRTFIHVEKLPDGNAQIYGEGDSSQLAGLAVTGVRWIIEKFPEHIDDMRTLLNKNFNDYEKPQMLSELIIKWIITILAFIGGCVIVLALIYGMGLVVEIGAHFLEKVEDAVMTWIMSF